MEKEKIEEKALEMLQALFNDNDAEPYEMAQAALSVIEKEQYFRSHVKECLAWFCLETTILLARKLEEDEYEYSDTLEWQAAATEVYREAKRGRNMRVRNTLACILEDQLDADQKNK